MKKRISFISILILFTFSCSSTPTKTRTSDLDKIELKGKAVITISIPHLTDASEIAAFTSGISIVTGSFKTLPTVPEELKSKTQEIVNSTLMESNSTVDFIISAANKLGKFDYLLLVTSEEVQINAGVLGIPISSSKGMLVYSKLYDASRKAFVSQASVPTGTDIPAGLPDADKAKLAVITSAARNGVHHLIHK